MHFGAEEMFFVLSGRPRFRNQHGEEELAPGDFVFCPEGRVATRDPDPELLARGGDPGIIARFEIPIE
jgi:DNA-binding transcriptional LysR family regulator